MSTTILQPCTLESQFIETTTLKLKVAALEFGTMETREKCKKPMHVGGNISSTRTTDLAGWSFLQVLSNVSSSTHKEEAMENGKESCYVHPLAKKYSSSRLSEKSLELCTENLGSETGTDDIVMDDSTILSFSSTSFNISTRDQKLSSPTTTREQQQSRNYKVNSTSRKFPPPLTTISGAASFQVRPHRENGRLVIKAVESPLKQSYFQAERSHGRLRLCFSEDHATIFDSQETNPADQENDVDGEDDEVDLEQESDFNDEDHLENQQFDDQEDDDDDEESGTNMSKDMNGNSYDIEVEMGINEKFQWLSRCNEGGHSHQGLCNWEPLWVATS